jgi:hypothetical protein
MILLSDKEPIYRELYEALAHFTGRLQLVLRAIIEQGVTPEGMRGVDQWHDKTPQKGLWGGEWKFYFHGGGCTLTHVETNEPIDWEGPYPHASSQFSFSYHLGWRLKHEAGLPLLHTYVDQHGLLAVTTLIDDLIDDGIITPDRRLIPAEAQA